MSEAYAREILKRNVAQICQTIGWNGINSTPLDILVHILEKYIRTLGTKANDYAEQFNRTEPNLNDLGLVFRDLHVNLPDLAEYSRCVPLVQLPVSVEKFPKPKESNLNFLKPGSHEVVTRPMHVHEHLPPMYPDKERDTPVVADTVEIRQNGIDIPGTSNACQSPEISVTDSPDKKDIFKRPIDPVLLPNKKPRLRVEEEERTREISSVMMTMTGFLSPAREGKLPEARPPTIILEKHTEKHKSNSNVSKVPPNNILIEKPEKKSKKSKLVNGKIMKSKRKDKSHKESSKSKDSSKLEKYPSGYPVKNRDIHPTHHNHVTMPAPKPVPRPIMLPPTPAVDGVKPVIKQEPVEPVATPAPIAPPAPPPVSRPISLPGEEAIPVPRKIPISRSPLVANTNPAHKQTPIIPETEIKKEKVEEEEKLASQPDRSKINIFKRITNKIKEDKNTLEVVPEKSQSDILISRLQSQDGLRIERNHFEHNKYKSNSIVNNNDGVAIDLTKQMNIGKTSDHIKNHTLKDIPEAMPFPGNHHLGPPAAHKAMPIPKIKKEKKHKEKRDKSIEKAAKLLKKRQLALMAQQMGNQNISNLKVPNSKSPKSSRPKNDSKFSHLPPGMLYPNMPPGLITAPDLITNPGLLPSEIYANLMNNPALRLPHPNLLANPFALGAAGPGLIPGSGFLPGGMHPMSMGGFGHSSRSLSRNIPPVLRRPSLEVIPLENDCDRSMHKSHIIKERHEKHKTSVIPNILQKHKSKVHKEKSSASKMSLVHPDITIELNPPRIEPPREVPRAPSPDIVPPRAERPPEPEPESPTRPPAAEPPEVTEEKVDKKKDKSHKKEKKDKDGVKAKKKKKDKNKEKSEKKKDKEDKSETDSVEIKIKKDKKEKKKEKSLTESLVPKLTLKLGSNSPRPPGSPDIFKLNIKPVVKKEEEEEPRPRSSSPELAQISALVTRPPKPPKAPVAPYYVDGQGTKIWVCPACGRPDNGSPMIGCDGCDCWYHWVCVGISEEPGSNEDWFCARCAAKHSAEHAPPRKRKDRTRDCR